MGYQTPPQSGQIKAGETRNRNGRPKGTKNRKTVARDIASKHHKITIEGKTKRVTVLEALLLRLQFLAIEKGGRALKEYLRLLDTYDIAEENSKHGTLLVPPALSLEEYEDLFDAHAPGTEHKPFMKVLQEVYGSKVVSK